LTIILIYIIVANMFVCICNQITESDIREVVRNGACSYKEVQIELGVGMQCGECKQCARNCIRQSHTLSAEQVYAPLATPLEVTTSAA